MISFKEILAYMTTGEEFSCKVVSYDRQKQKGGEIKNYKAVLMQAEHTYKLRPLTESEKAENPPKNNKKPNHYQHYTRNIRIVTDDGFKTDIIKKIHIPLIFQFNGLKVTP